MASREAQRVFSSWRVEPGEVVRTWEQARPPELCTPDTWPGRGQQKSMTEKQLPMNEPVLLVFAPFPQVWIVFDSETEIIIIACL